MHYLFSKGQTLSGGSGDVDKYLNEIKTAMQSLPDGSAVSAQVALNTAEISRLDEVCFDDITYLDETVDINVTQGVVVNSDPINISGVSAGNTIKLTFGGIYDVLGRWGYGILQRKKAGGSFAQADLINYNHFNNGYDYVVQDGDEELRLNIPANQSSASGTIAFSAYININNEALYKKELKQVLDGFKPDLFGLQDDFTTAAQKTPIKLDLKNGDVLTFKIENAGSTNVYSQLYAGNTLQPMVTKVVDFKTLNANKTLEGEVVVTGITEANNTLYYRVANATDKVNAHFSLKKGVMERVSDIEEELKRTNLRGVDAIKKYAELPLLMLKNKDVDETNRLVVAFNGDSIIGSQLDDITNCSTYNTGVFPPNLSKQIMARMFWEKYRFGGEDVEFRNLRHSAWTKTGFDVDKSASTETFNEFECYAPSSANDKAEITINATKDTWIKVVYGYCGGGALNVVIKKGSSTITSEKVGNDTNDKRLHQYKIYKITSGTHTVTITPDASNYDKCRLWGCEYWSNPRLDVVVGAYSGSTSPRQLAEMKNAWYGGGNKPALIISDVLFINDNAEVRNNSFSIIDWKKSVTELNNIAKDAGVPVIYFIYHNPTNATILGKYAKMLSDFNEFRAIDMEYIYQNVYFPEVWVREGDGLHLNNLGNERYFAELDKIFS